MFSRFITQKGRSFIRLGDEVVIDASSVSAVYPSGDRLVIRIGVGIVEVHRRHLSYTFEECVEMILKG